MHTLEQLRAGELCGARHLKLAENLTVFPSEILNLKETLEVLDLTGKPSKIVKFATDITAQVAQHRQRGGLPLHRH